MTPSELKHLYGEYLEYSMRYYCFDESVVPDHEFDHICGTLLENWDSFDHKYKKLTTPDDLRAGTGFMIDTTSVPFLADLIRKYPERRLKDVFKS